MFLAISIFKLLGSKIRGKQRSVNLPAHGTMAVRHIRGSAADLELNFATQTAAVRHTLALTCH